MSYPVLFRSLAEQDTRQAIEWYELHAPDQIERFIEDLDSTITRMRSSPLLFRTQHANARRAPLERFPYLVWYRILAEPKVIEVLAVVHERQGHERFSGRL